MTEEKKSNDSSMMLLIYLAGAFLLVKLFEKLVPKVTLFLQVHHFQLVLIAITLGVAAADLGPGREQNR